MAGSVTVETDDGLQFVGRRKQLINLSWLGNGFRKEMLDYEAQCVLCGISPRPVGIVKLAIKSMICRW